MSRRANPLAIVGIALALATAGCQTTYGGKTFDVTIEGDPSASVYVIPLMSWEEHGRDELLKSSKALAEYCVSTSTPATVRMARRAGYVVAHRIGDARPDWRTYTAVKSGDVIDFRPRERR